MDVDEILENYCEDLKYHSPDCEDAEIAQKYMPKLFKVYKLSKRFKEIVMRDGSYSSDVTADIFDAISEVDEEPY